MQGSLRQITRNPTNIALIVSLPLLVIRAGLGVYPFAHFLSEKILSNPDLIRETPALFQFVFLSPIGLWMAWLFQIRTFKPYIALHVVSFGFFLLIAVRKMWTNHNRDVAGLTLALIATSQAAAVCLFWIGSYDVFTFGLFILLVTMPSHRVAPMIGVLLAFSAAEQSFLILCGLIALATFDLIENRIKFWWAMGGLVVGRVILQFWLKAFDLRHGRLFWVTELGPRHFLDMFLRGLPLLILTGLGGSVFAVVLTIRSITVPWKRLFLIGILFAALVPTALTEDQTRTFSLLTFPLILGVVIQWSRSASSKQIQQLTLVTLLTGLAIPSIIIWKGTVHISDWHILHLFS